MRKVQLGQDILQPVAQPARCPISAQMDDVSVLSSEHCQVGNHLRSRLQGGIEN